MMTEVLNSVENVKCNEVAGAMFAFPRITLPKKAIEAAKVSCLVSGPGTRFSKVPVTFRARNQIFKSK